MYAIYTNIFGIKIPTELNKKFQCAELSEMFDDSELPDGFECDVPYSGDGYADIHLGVTLSSTDGRGKPVTVPTAKQIAICKEGIKELKEQIQKSWEEWKTDYPENDFGEDDDKLVEEFLNELDKEPETYTAYSTS